MSDDGVRSGEVVACQKESVPSSLRNDQAAICRARRSHPMSPMISASKITCWFTPKLGTRFVHSHQAPVEDLSIQCSDGGLGFSPLRHFNKRNAARLARVPVYDERDGFDGSIHGKNVSQLLLCCRDIKVPDENVVHKFIPELIFPNISLEPEADFQRRSGEIAFFAKRRALREALRSQPASPWGPSSRRTAPLGPPEGS